MLPPPRHPQDPEDRSAQASALEQLEAIRSVLDHTTQYTHVSALGTLLAGLLACLAATVGAVGEIEPRHAGPFLGLWGLAFLGSLTAGILTSAHKARRLGETLWNRKLRFVLLRLSPAAIVSALLTVTLAETGRLDLAPGVWAALYGMSVLSVAYVLDWEYQLAGWSFLVVSAAALFLLRASPNLSMGIGFGAVHVTFGARRLLKELSWKRLPRSLASRS